MRNDASVKRVLAPHGILGLGLVLLFWMLNWALSGTRTHFLFFPLWLGYCLLVDALVLYRTGTSLLERSRKKFLCLFLASAPAWWLFEIINWRLQNWHYLGAEDFSSLSFWCWATLNFSTVMPAVFESAELIASFNFFKGKKKGPFLRPTTPTTIAFFTTGWMMLAAMLAWPDVFFPFTWLAVFFILEPLNIWLGNRTLAEYTGSGDWRPVLHLWLGVLLTALFWEMWNYLSYPKWIYRLPWGDWFRIFEMPLPGYLGYLPFSLELFSLYHFLCRIFGEARSGYIRLLSSRS